MQILLFHAIRRFQCHTDWYVSVETIEYKYITVLVLLILQQIFHMEIRSRVFTTFVIAERLKKTDFWLISLSTSFQFCWWKLTMNTKFRNRLATCLSKCIWFGNRSIPLNKLEIFVNFILSSLILRLCKLRIKKNPIKKKPRENKMWDKRFTQILCDRFYIIFVVCSVLYWYVKLLGACILK